MAFLWLEAAPFDTKRSDSTEKEKGMKREYFASYEINKLASLSLRLFVFNRISIKNYKNGQEVGQEKSQILVVFIQG